MPSNSNQHNQGQQLDPIIYRASLRAKQRCNYIAALSLLIFSSVFALVTTAVNVVNLVKKQLTSPYVIFYFVSSGLVFACGILAAVLLLFYKRTSSTGRNFSCFIITFPMLSATASTIACLLSVYTAAITYRPNSVVELFITSTGQAVVYITSAILSLLGLLLSAQMWKITERINALNTVVPNTPSATNVQAHGPLLRSASQPTNTTVPRAVAPSTATTPSDTYQSPEARLASQLNRILSPSNRSIPTAPDPDALPSYIQVFNN